MKNQNHSLPQPKPKHRTLNQAKIKRLAFNLKLRLQYANLKVINGWHNRTLSEVESAFYLSMSQKNSKRTSESSKPQINFRIPRSMLPGLSFSSSSSSGPSQSSGSLNSLDQTQSNPDPFKPQSPTHPFNFSFNQSPTPNLSLDQSSSNLPVPPNQAEPQSDQTNLNPAFILRKSKFISSATLTLPMKYSTPFKKKSASEDPSDSFPNKSNAFWPTDTLDYISASPIIFNHSSSSDKKDILNQESPATAFINRHRQSLFDPSPFTKSFGSNFLNSVSPVRTGSPLHHQLNTLQKLTEFHSSTLASPTPCRTRKPHVNKIFASLSKLKSEHDQERPSVSDNLPRKTESDDNGDLKEEDKENWMDLIKTDCNMTPQSSPLKSKFNLPPPPFPTTASSTSDGNHDCDHDKNEMEELFSNPTQTSLDDLDTLLWD